MTPQKRKADAVSLAESDESPHKRARSESTDRPANNQNGNAHILDEPSNEHAEPSITPANPSGRSQTVPDIKNEAALFRELPQSWDQADAADKMLVMMKEKNKKYSWAKIERDWERSTGEKPAKDMLSDRYKRLKDIMAHLKAGATRSETTALPSKSTSAAPTNEVAPEHDLPQSWEQANVGDQLLVRMKTGKKGWARIKEAWQKLTGERAAEGALEDRYTRIKGSVIYPGTNGAYTHKRIRTPRKLKAEAENSEESLDESSDEPSDEPSDESSDEFSRHSKQMARRKPRSAVKQQMRARAFDGPSDEPASIRTKASAEEPASGRAEAGSSDESDGIANDSITVAKSTKRPHRKSAVTAKSGAQNTAETADEMVVEMRERGCTWDEITEAWNNRTGFTHVSETLRKRYYRIKGGSSTKRNPVIQASSKRKVKAISPDEDSYDSSAKRRKSTAETSRSTENLIKRNMDRGKRKSSVKYAESTTDEDELFAAPVEPVTTTPAKRNAGRHAKVNRSDPEWLVTNEKSPLAYEDLHAEFSDPKAYENFTKSDWEDLRETLPPDVPVNPDGYSIPMTFFKYDPDFRRGIREFQEDLASGRLDPKWQADAAQAMEERARGEFDAYKENQFEAFWGQKQKLSHDALAGESTKIKLYLLIQNEIFKVGDYFSYSRVFGRGKNGVLVEKDCKIVKVNGKALTFAIPSGRRKYPRRMFESGTPGDIKPGTETIMAGGGEQPLAGVNSKPGAVQALTDTKTNGDEASEASEKGDGALFMKETAENGNSPDNSKAQDAEFIIENKTDENGTAETINPENTDFETKNKGQENEGHESAASEESNLKAASAQTNGGEPYTPAIKEEDILHSISSLRHLENEIIDIDGRFKSKDIPTTNAWKSFRGIRNNQDLGTLFEMREEFYVYKHPQIVKEAKEKR